MCQDCGCSITAPFTVTSITTKSTSRQHYGKHEHTHEHRHHHETHEHTHTMHHHSHADPSFHHSHSHSSQANTASSSESMERVTIQQDILNENNRIAGHNREHLEQHQVAAFNWISAPGSGKTSLLEALARQLPQGVTMGVIEGDQRTDNDAKRLAKLGIAAVQINTGSACHLDAAMVHEAFHQLNLAELNWLMIENVGNMVCPTAYNLGEHHKIAVISTPEGSDKPEKYPDLILTAELLVINKIDLAPHLDFDLEQCRNAALRIKPTIKVLTVSAKTGQGMQDLLNWLQTHS